MFEWLFARHIPRQTSYEKMRMFYWPRISIPPSSDNIFCSENRTPNCFKTNFNVDMNFSQIESTAQRINYLSIVNIWCNLIFVPWDKSYQHRMHLSMQYEFYRIQKNSNTNFKNNYTVPNMNYIHNSYLIFNC